MSREQINPIILHQMLHDIVQKLDSGLISYRQFQFEPLFINIYYCFYFVKFLSPYYTWGDELIKFLRKNIRKKWRPVLPNVELFLDQLDKKNEQVDPFDYWFQSEDYFQKLCALKPIADVLFPVKKKKKRRRKYVKNYKPIR